MSIDYSANFGVGYKVALPSSTKYPDEFIENALSSVGKTHKIDWFDTGSDYMPPEYDNKEYFVVLSEPFKDGTEAFVRRASALKEILQECGLEVIGEFDVVGGLCIS
ncbi:MAG: hypothetical protein IPL33_14695 [Sphingobacteriales bacterium]|nr:hypothetical protein [Sphingobacteriales bacterium]MCC7223696.1 hypothetical protein [Chitinophagales bacterium]